jgi:hypothetical protein
VESSGGTSSLDVLPFADDPATVFPHLPGIRDLWPALTDWAERIQLVTGHGLGLWPIWAPLADRYHEYARALGFTEEQIEPSEPEDGWVAPLGCLIDVTPAGMLQCCLQHCEPFQTDDPAFVRDVRDAKPRPPLPAKDRRLLLELLAHALLTYEQGCQELERSGSIQGKITACAGTLEWLSEVLPLLEEDLRTAIRSQQDLQGLTIKQIGGWLQTGLRILQAFRGLTNNAYANMADPFHSWSRSLLDGQVPSLRRELLGTTFPDARAIEAPPLAKLKNLVYTRRWPKSLDQNLLLDMLLVRMHAAFRWYGPSAWRDSSIYPAIVAILRRFGIERVALTPGNLIKRVGRLRKTINDIPRDGSAAKEA